MSYRRRALSLHRGSGPDSGAVARPVVNNTQSCNMAIRFTEDAMQIRSLGWRLVLTALVSWAPARAYAHIRMITPMPRHPGDNPPLKQAPCGVTGENRSTMINRF